MQEKPWLCDLDLFSWLSLSKRGRKINNYLRSCPSASRASDCGSSKNRLLNQLLREEKKQCRSLIHSLPGCNGNVLLLLLFLKQVKIPAFSCAW